jgi:hypothetical protein
VYVMFGCRLLVSSACTSIQQCVKRKKNILDLKLLLGQRDLCWMSDETSERMNVQNHKAAAVLGSCEARRPVLCLHRTSAAASENNVPKVSFQQDDDLLPFLENTMNCSIAIALSLARAIEYCYRYDKRVKHFPKQSSITRLFVLLNEKERVKREQLHASDV